MDLMGFASQMAQRGCVGDGRLFCGSFQGYPFSAEFVNGRAGGGTTFTVRLQVQANVTAKMFREVAKTVKGSVGRAIRTPGSQDQLGIQAVIKQDEGFSSGFDSLLAAMVSYMREHGMTAPDSCPVCSAAGCDSYAYMKGSYRPAHAACVHANAALTVQKVEKNEYAGNYALGAIGALLGALVGSIPNIITIHFMERIFYILCALIPICSYYGYKLLRGKMTRLSLAFVIPFSLLTIPVMDYVLTGLAYYDSAWGWIITPSVYVQALQNDFSEFLPLYLQMLLFVGVGIAIAWSIIARGNQDSIRTATHSEMMLRPIDGRQQPAQAVPAYVAGTAAPTDPMTTTEDINF